MKLFARLRCPHGTPDGSWINDVTYWAILCGLPAPMWVCEHCQKVFWGQQADKIMKGVVSGERR